MDQALSILLVEDDEDTRANLCDILALDRHNVVPAGNFADARTLAQQSLFEIVILDRKLPDGTAEEFIPELNQQFPDAHIIVVTGFADLDSTISAFRGGAADFILKPINPDALRESIRRIRTQRQTRLNLLREQQFANQILETAEAVILVLDLHGRIVRFNPYFTRVTGWELSELVGKDWFDHCIPDSEQERIREVFLLAATNVHTSGIVNSVLTKTGLERYIRWSNTTLTDETGASTSVLAVGVDVTEQLIAQQQASRSERLAAIGETMTALAHESRNALQRIQASVEMLELDLSDDQENMKDVQAIKRASNDLQDLLEELRSYAAPIRLQLQRCTLLDIYRRAWRNLGSQRKDRDANLIESACDQSVSIDPMRMEQVFRNLFENSLAAGDDPVRIEIQINQANENLVEIAVSDNGPGFDAEQTQKLFEPFYTTKSAGTGLGLSICRRIIEAHHGTIDIESDSGSHSQTGARFVIRLPIDSEIQDPGCLKN